jgi:hypothetical protein|tara:strand:- start:218 stop:436 length:219 start_codon:yes stop_codon:yes gene_type:complete
MINDMTEDQWAIMVCLNKEDDDWIFVTEDTGSCDWNLKPVLFNDINEAIAYAGTFALPDLEENVQVVNFNKD